MIANYSVPVGTEVKFGPSSRLRAIDKKTNKFLQKDFLEGAIIGEGKKGKIVQRLEELNKVAYVVELESGHFGWGYNFEFYLP